MPKFKYIGTAPKSYGGAKVQPGQVIDSSSKPGKMFVEVKAPTPSPTPKKKENS